MHANQLRLYFSSVAYMLIQTMRRIGLKDTSLAKAQCSTIRLKLLKIGAQVQVTVRRVWVPYGERLSLCRRVRGGLHQHSETSSDALLNPDSFQPGPFASEGQVSSELRILIACAENFHSSKQIVSVLTLSNLNLSNPGRCDQNPGLLAAVSDQFLSNL